ncbi:MAG: heme ABC transporter ATP-binding protein [Burkholderiales bacterium]|nr:heme ABC transporter ATP-binding protein [Burkholderiales bacterium]
MNMVGTSLASGTSPASAASTLIALDGARLQVGATVLVHDLRFAVAPGEVVCLLGPNGAGKSTALKLMSGEHRPTHGSALFEGRPVQTWSARALATRRAVMGQEPRLAFDFTASEVALLGRYPHCGGRPGRDDRRIAAQALDLAGASALAGRIVTTLSGGERARVHFARALAQVGFERDGVPRALLLDEPTASLDAAHQHAWLRTARALAADARLAVLAVVHDLNLAALHADRVVLMQSGRVLAQGHPDAVLDAATVLRCFDVRTVRVPAADVAGRTALAVIG